jgi:mannose-6-phosphate isomerase
MTESNIVGPIRLPANQPRARFYRGGQRIATFRGDGPAAPNTPEDWVGSATSVRGTAPVGMTRLPGGELLADAFVSAPLDWFGPAHVDRWGHDPMLLVKLLDPGQRLPIHAHPSGAFAARTVAAAHGKAEAWYILEAGTVYLGLTHSVSPAELLALVTAQDTGRMLGLMHEIEVAPGDTVFVPAGVLHAIGEGTFLAEVQEPEDLSILLEWTGFDLDGAADGHLGLGFDVALAAVEHEARSAQEISALIHHVTADGPTLVPASAEFFRLDRISTPTELAAGFAIVIATAGSLTLTTDAATTDLPSGSTTLVPFAAGPMHFAGAGEVLVARPPAAD